MQSSSIVDDEDSNVTEKSFGLIEISIDSVMEDLGETKSALCDFANKMSSMDEGSHSHKIEALEGEIRLSKEIEMRKESFESALNMIDDLIDSKERQLLSIRTIKDFLGVPPPPEPMFKPTKPTEINLNLNQRRYSSRLLPSPQTIREEFVVNNNYTTRLELTDIENNNNTTTTPAGPATIKRFSLSASRLYPSSSLVNLNCTFTERIVPTLHVTSIDHQSSRSNMSTRCNSPLIHKQFTSTASLANYYNNNNTK